MRGSVWCLTEGAAQRAAKRRASTITQKSVKTGHFDPKSYLHMRDISVKLLFSGARTQQHRKQLEYHIRARIRVHNGLLVAERGQKQRKSVKIGHFDQNRLYTA